MTRSLYVAYEAQGPSQLIYDAKDLVRYFCSECGFRPLPWMQRQFLDLLSRGYDVSTLKSIIDDTARAPRPSWAYLEAIIRNSEEQVRNFARRFPPPPAPPPTPSPPSHKGRGVISISNQKRATYL